jgi:CrcB protein
MTTEYILYIGLGGAAGSLLRAFVSTVLPFQLSSFSWGTFIVNMVGCFLIGWFWVKLENPAWKAFLVTGLLGGLTTFSGLGLELFRYFNEKSYFLLATYALVSVFVGIFLVWFGQKLAS